MSELRSIGPNSAKRAILTAFNVRKPIFLWGAPGIGKSDIIHQIGNQLNRNVIDIRLALWEPTDIKGIPFYNPELGSMVWAPPIELPSNPSDTSIVLLDEFNTAPPAVQAAAYQLILNRRVGTYVLPDGVDIVAAGNREGDRGVVYRMPSPLANRFIHLELDAVFDDWQEWAINNNIHPDVIGYLGYAKQDLYDFNPKSPSKSFATPRSWSFVSDLLYDTTCNADTLTQLIAGSIGDGLAIKFAAHRKFASELPDISDILNGTVKDLKIQEISAMYSLVISLCYELRERLRTSDLHDWHAMTDYFFTYMMKNFPTELVVVGAKTALINYNLPLDRAKMESFSEFQSRFGKYIVTAIEG